MYWGYKMKLVKMIVKDYRQFEKAELAFDDNITILAGANNSGKTSLITLIKNIISKDQSSYKESDIRARNMKEWIDKTYYLFEKFYLNSYKVNQTEEELVNKILPFETDKEQILISTTEVYMQIDYDIDLDDIKLFADYIMDLDENEHSFYFVYSYEINRRLFRKNLEDSYDKLKKRFSEMKEPNKEIKKRYLQELLIRIYVQSINQVCYYCDKNYENRCSMDDVTELRRLFNFTYIKASRPLDDDDSDHSHMLSKQMIKMVKSDENWNDLIHNLPDELLKPIQDADIAERVRCTSLNSLKDTISALEQTNGGQAGELMLDMSIGEDDISELLQRITSTIYNIDGYYLGESSQGLGYSNMIYMHLQLKEYEKGIDPLRVNVFFIEEPESHMHPQMQQVFIKYLIEYYKEKGLQGVVTTHSNEMVRIAGISHLRAIRKVGKFKSNLYNPSILIDELKKSGDDQLANFFDWFFEIGYSEIVFADKVIFYEGDTERLFIRKLLTMPRYEKLKQQYIAYVQVGGAYAYNYRRLINLLGIKSLIITDLDYDKSKTELSDVKKSEITNATIKNFYKELNNENPTVEKLYEWYGERKNIFDHSQIYLAFQTENDSYARTLEEAMLGKLFGITIEQKFMRSEWLNKKQDSKLEYSIPRNIYGEIDSKFSVRDILKSTSGAKTDFMYSVILNNLVDTMEPQYISEGLKWLME